MPVTCNINRKGRLARALWGAALLLAGIAWLIWGRPLDWWEWVAVAFLILGGIFALIVITLFTTLFLLFS